MDTFRSFLPEWLESNRETDVNGDSVTNVVVTREEFSPVSGAFHLHNLLTDEECAKWIAKGEEVGFDNATHPKYQNEKIDRRELANRSNIRSVYEASEEEVGKLWERCKPFMPHSIYGGEWEVSGINDMWRFYKYEEGQKFNIHFDNQFVKTWSNRSHFSFLIYLNDDFEGGETTFYRYSEEQQKLLPYRVRPRKGSAMLFYHTGKNSPLHEGSPHTTAGKSKYVIRTDLMFTRTDDE